MPGDHLLAIPVFNEAEHLDRVIEQARRYCSDLLVVDDGSTDATPQLLRRHDGLSVITHPENRGYGKSLADAFCFAMRRQYAWLITMDCDEQHEPSYIPRFVSVTQDDGADVISGTRYPRGFDAADADSAPSDRREINRLVTETLNRRLGLRLSDAFCGFKAYRVSALRSLRITVPGYAMPIQFWVQAARLGLRIRELPVRLIYKDPTRHFGGMLDDPSIRLRHYLALLESELRHAGTSDAPRRASCAPCR